MHIARNKKRLREIDRCSACACEIVYEALTMSGCKRNPLKRGPEPPPPRQCYEPLAPLLETPGASSGPRPPLPESAAGATEPRDVWTPAFVSTPDEVIFETPGEASESNGWLPSLLDAAMRGPLGTTCKEELKYVILGFVSQVNELVHKVKELNMEVDRLDKEIQELKEMQVTNEIPSFDTRLNPA